MSKTVEDSQVDLEPADSNPVESKQANRRTRSPFTLSAAIFRQRLLIIVLLLLVCVVLPVAFFDSVRTAGYLLGGLLLLVAFLRLVLKVEVLGGLVVRRKWIDLLILCSLAGGIIALSSTPSL